MGVSYKKTKEEVEKKKKQEKDDQIGEEARAVRVMYAIHNAVLEDDETALRRLLREPPSASLCEGSLLLEAASKGQHRIVQLLLDRVPNLRVDATNAEGWTALHLAAFEGHFEVVKVLAERALIWKLTHDNHTALAIAIRRGHFRVADLLVECLRSDNQLSQAFRVAVGQDEVFMAAYLIRANHQKLLSSYWLLKAAEDGKERVAILIVNTYAKLHGPQHMGKLLAAKGGRGHVTPLHYAVRLEMEKLATRLLEFRCPQQFCADKDGRTELWHALLSLDPKEQVVKAVLKRNPNALRIKDCYGNTPVDILGPPFIIPPWLEELCREQLSFDELFARGFRSREETISLIEHTLIDRKRMLLLCFLPRDVSRIVCAFVVPYKK